MRSPPRYKTIRAVVEVRVPEHITEKRLVWWLKDKLIWPIQLGNHGDTSTRARPTFKAFSRVLQAELRKRGE